MSMVALHFTLFASCIARRTFGDRKKDKTLAGDGSEGAQDGTEKSCSFVQVHGICSVSDTLFTTDGGGNWRENQTYDGFVRNNRLFKTPWHSE